MTDEDILARATRALKESAAEETPEAGLATRRAILDAADVELRRTRRNRFLVMPIAATFVLLATWAGASGNLARVFSTRGGADLERTPPSPSVAPTANSTAPLMPELPPAPPASVPAEPAPKGAPVIVAETASASPTVRPARSTSADAAEGPADVLYAKAHRAHFEDHDWDDALRAWDAYLASEPRGRFAPEARYNRGLCLIRLGRTDEARAALEPFASGSVGGYRKDEASSLLRALADAATP